VVEDYEAQIVALVRDGFNVRTGLVCYGTVVEGPFADESDSFDPARHRLKARTIAGHRLRRALRDAELEKRLVDKPKPQPLTFLDLASGRKNTVLTPGGDARLVGRNLRFAPGDPRQGVFFVAADGSETRVERVSWNAPSHLIFCIPDLAAGAYGLEVRNIPRDGQELRSGRMDTVLIVPATTS
jgi:hypothetical protein